jgi:hypothetical protein
MSTVPEAPTSHIGGGPMSPALGQEVSDKTSDQMMKLMGGAAYGLTGLLTALRQVEYRGKVVSEKGETEPSVVLSAIANGIQGRWRS